MFGSKSVLIRDEVALNDIAYKRWSCHNLFGNGGPI